MAPELGAKLIPPLPPQCSKQDTTHLGASVRVGPVALRTSHCLMTSRRGKVFRGVAKNEPVLPSLIDSPRSDIRCPALQRVIRTVKHRPGSSGRRDTHALTSYLLRNSPTQGKFEVKSGLVLRNSKKGWAKLQKDTLKGNRTLGKRNLSRFCLRNGNLLCYHYTTSVLLSSSSYVAQPEVHASGWQATSASIVEF